MDIPQAKMGAGNYGPSNREVPSKIKDMLADLKRWAKCYEAPFSFPKNIQVGLWSVGVLFAIEKEEEEVYVNAAYAKSWGEGCGPH